MAGITNLSVLQPWTCQNTKWPIISCRMQRTHIDGTADRNPRDLPPKKLNIVAPPMCTVNTHAWLGPSVMGKFIGMFMYFYTVSTYERKHKPDNPDSYSQAKLFLPVLSPLFYTNITYSTCCSFHCLSSLN